MNSFRVLPKLFSSARVSSNREHIINPQNVLQCISGTSPNVFQVIEPNPLELNYSPEQIQILSRQFIERTHYALNYEIPGAKREHLFSTLRWYHKVFIPAYNALSRNMDSNNLAKFIDFIKNETKTQFNLDFNLEDRYMKAVNKDPFLYLLYLRKMIHEKITIPNGLYVYESGEGHFNTEPILYEPQEFITPDGNKVKAYTHYSCSEKYETTACCWDSIITYPQILDVLYNIGELAKYSHAINQVKADKSLGIVRQQFNNIESYRRFITAEWCIKSTDPVNEYKMEVLGEEFEHYDSGIVAVKRLGYTPLHKIEEVGAIVKPGSYAYEQFSKAASLGLSNQVIISAALNEVRAKLGNLRKGHSPFPPFTFYEAVAISLDESANIGPEHYKLARNCIRDLLSPLLLGKTSNQVRQSDWLGFLHDNVAMDIRAGNTNSQTNVLIDKLDLASKQILEENFYLK